MENTKDLSAAAYNLFQKTADSYKYRYDPYCKIDSLFEQHRALMRRDDYKGDGDRWVEHLELDLMKFWLNGSVTDMSKGLFRSFLTDDGKPLPGLDRQGEWPSELRRAIEKDSEGNYATEAGGLLEGPDRNADMNFVRSHSRQTFAYGIAYHITGKVEYFELCRKAALALLKLVDQNGMYTKQRLDNGEWIHDVEKRTSQDLAYGMTGIAFYYYLTHDEEVLEKILALKEYIFREYYHPGTDVFSWLPQKNQTDKQSLELVAHLDQLYAYMLWLTPALPRPHKDEFMDDMKNIARIMIERFYSEVYGTFWGASNSVEMKVLGAAHTDFGHSVKAMWVIYQVGVWTKEPSLMNFARPRIHAILENAFDEGNGSWNRRIGPEGKIDKDKEWWSLAELNQAAALLALKDPSYLQYLNRTYAFWFQNMVDHKNGEIWHVLDGETLLPKRIFPKAHCWKNALHTFEHALFGYLTTKQFLGEPIPLYYAFHSTEEVVHQTVTPYLFKANIIDKEAVKENGNAVQIPDGDGNRLNIKVTFQALH